MKLGFVGLGNMGNAMAINLLKKGYNLAVYDINENNMNSLPQQNINKCKSPKDVACQSDVTFLSLPRPDTVIEVVSGKEGLLSGASEGHIIVDLSTTDPGTIRKLKDVCSYKDVDILDAPVSGGVKGAEKGTLSIMVGGQEKTFNKLKPIMECIGNNIFYAGDIGSGAAAKLIGQYLNAVNLVAVCEGFALGKKLGLHADKLYEILSVGSGNSYQLQYRFKNHISKRRFEPGFAIDLMIKDLRLVNKSVEDASSLMFLGGVVKQLYEFASLKGLGDEDTSAVIKIFEEV